MQPNASTQGLAPRVLALLTGKHLGRRAALTCNRSERIQRILVLSLSVVFRRLRATHERDAPEYGRSGQYQTRRYGLGQKNEAAHSRDNRNTELNHRRSGSFQRRHCRVPNGVTHAGGQCPRRNCVPKSCHIPRCFMQRD